MPRSRPRRFPRQARRWAILDGYVALVAGLSTRSRAADLALGVDAPF